MLPHFPLDRDTYAMSMGTRPLGAEPLIEVDPAAYGDELALKEAILAENHRYYFQAAPGSEAAQWETVAEVLAGLARDYPAHFALDRDGDRWRWRNTLLDDETAFRLGDPASLPWAPLDWLGRQVQEDLLLMDGQAAGAPLIAGQLCFAAGWCLDDKMGQSFLTIHDPVPTFRAGIGRSADLLMARLKVGHPVTRLGWGITTADQLNCAPILLGARRHRRDGITAANAGACCFFRVERQALVRLPRTRAVLFTIHTYRHPIATVAADPARRARLASVLRAMPEPIRAYKGLPPFIDALLAYLDSTAAGDDA